VRAEPTGRPAGRPPKAPELRTTSTAKRRSEARRTVAVDPTRPSPASGLLAAFDEAIVAAEWLRGPDAVSVALLRETLERIKADPSAAPRLIPVAVSIAINLGLTPESRARLNLALDDRPEAAPAAEHGVATEVTFR